MGRWWVGDEEESAVHGRYKLPPRESLCLKVSLRKLCETAHPTPSLECASPRAALTFQDGPHCVCGMCIFLNKSTAYLLKTKKKRTELFRLKFQLFRKSSLDSSHRFQTVLSKPSGPLGQHFPVWVLQDTSSTRS